MGKLRQIIDSASQQITRMSASQKLLIGSLAVIAAMTLFLVSQYAAKPSLVDLMADSSDPVALATLRGAGIDAQVVDGSIQVPPSQRSGAVAVLSQAGQLPGDTTLLFQNLIQSQDWKASKEQHRQQYTIALQNELSRVISRFRMVDRASVILDVPQVSGLGRATRVPTASITIFTSGGAVSQDTVDAAAGLVMGAVSGLEPKNVQVVDGSTGTARYVSDEDSRSSSKFLEFSREVEHAKKRQIEEMLAHIPGVVVSVTAMVDVTSVASTERAYAPEQKGSVSLLRSQTGLEDSVQQQTRGAEAGVRSNQTASINTGSAAGTSSNTNENSKEFDNQFGYVETQTVDPRGMPTHMRASIIVPEEYVRNLLERHKAAAAADGTDAEPVTDEEVRDRFEGIDGNSGLKGLIMQQVAPHLIGQGADGAMLTGDVNVAMSPFGDAYRAGGQIQSAGFMGGFMGGSGGPMLGNGNLVETVLVGVLAAIAVVLMLMMVKRASKKVELPTAEELLGMPPQLESLSDLIGEADESETAMQGIEVDDAIVQIQKLREQVGDLIKSDPNSAAGLVERWAELQE